jgi:predicted negative regulator of RcsB-dependent stress response
MARITSRRRVALESPDEMLTQAQRLWEVVKPYVHWLAVAAVVLAVVLGLWGINAWMKGNRETKAAEALILVTSKVDFQAPTTAAVQDLGKFVKEYSGTGAAREAQLLRANLLYDLERYPEAAKAYESLRDSRDPGWDALVADSLSYCYAGMGNFKKAAAVLKPVVEQTYGPLRGEVMQRLALLYEKAQEPKEAAVYWRKLLDHPGDAALMSYFREKLAAAEAQGKK